MDDNTRNGMASSKNVHWNTPNVVLTPIRTHFGQIALDPCSNPTSIVNARKTYSGPGIDKDGLKESWLAKGVTFVNPVYGRGPNGIKPWVAKCVAEAKLMRDSADELILLGPARTDTAFFQDLVCPTANQVLLWKGRLTFLGAPAGAFFPSFLAYWGYREDLFRIAFADKGVFIL